LVLDVDALIATVERSVQGRDGDEGKALTPEVEAEVRALTARALQARPDVELTLDAWARALAPALGSADPADALRRLHAGDLWLAAGLGVADPAALAAFERELIPEVDRALRRLAGAPDELDELRQWVRVRLLVADPPEQPRISSYEGTARLSRWIRTIATRVAFTRHRLTKRYAGVDPVPEVVLETTPELARLRSEHHELFVSSLKEAFRELDPENRTLLRLRYADGLTAVAISRAYQMHESTISRRLAAARQAVAESFERIASERLGKDREAFSLLQMMRSQVESSLDSLLASTD